MPGICMEIIQGVVAGGGGGIGKDCPWIDSC